MGVRSRETVVDCQGDRWVFEWEFDGALWRQYVTAPGLDRRELVSRTNPPSSLPVDAEQPLPLGLT